MFVYLPEGTYLFLKKNLHTFIMFAHLKKSYANKKLFSQIDCYSTHEAIKNTANQHHTEVSIQAKMQT